MAKKPFRGLSLQVSTSSNDLPSSYRVTDSGTFQEGDFTINRRGLSIQGSTPATTRRLSAGSETTGGLDNLGIPQNPQEAELDIQLSSSRYEDLDIVHPVGHGSSGFVRKVIHRPTGAEVVLKEISFDLSSEQLRKQTTTELRTLYGCYHPNVVKYYNAFFEQGSFAILMEFMDGGSLADLLQAVHKVPEQYVGAIAKQILQGLHYLHKELRVVHRDLKPSNLLLNKRGEVKIADFGVSSQLANTMAAAQTFVGTTYYMSPERIQGEPSYSFESDIWSVGLLLLECALGFFPYCATKDAAPITFFEMLTKVTGDEPPAPNPEAHSAEFCDFISNCLQKDPMKRWSAAQLLTHSFITSVDPRITVTDLL